MENPIEMEDLGGTPTEMETSINCVPVSRCLTHWLKMFHRPTSPLRISRPEALAPVRVDRPETSPGASVARRSWVG